MRDQLDMTHAMCDTPFGELLHASALWCWRMKLPSSLSTLPGSVTCPAAWSGLWNGPAGEQSNMQIPIHHLDVVSSAAKVCLLLTLVSHDVLRQWSPAQLWCQNAVWLCSSAVLCLGCDGCQP